MPLFTDLNLRPELLKAIEEQGYTEPTPIQVQAIPLVLAGRDVLGGAQTGTGKTAGFGLPLLHRLLPHANSSTSPARHPVRALVLAPTRELAAQVEESLRGYAKYSGLRTAVIFGGVNMLPQTEALRRGVEVLVATPGRLLDHAQQKTLNLSQVEVFVLDEADRMLDMGFIPDVKRIISMLPAKRQNLLFSATFSEEIRKLADSFLHDPVMVQVARRNATAESVRHVAVLVSRERKRELLGHIVESKGLKQVLVFTATRLGANRLAYQLNRDGINATAIHGDKSQPERLIALNDFKQGKVRVLVATDVAARGLDIEDLPHVINFDLPNSPEDYVHRIGRTGRAGASGEAISLVSPDEIERLQAIEKTIKLTIPRENISGYEGGAGAHETDRDGPRENRFKREGGRRPSRERDRPARTDRSKEGKTPSVRPPVASDPIFLEPYRPDQSSAPAADHLPERAVPSRARAPQVAALLGGSRVKSK